MATGVDAPGRGQRPGQWNDRSTDGATSQAIVIAEDSRIQGVDAEDTQSDTQYPTDQNVVLENKLQIFKLKLTT